MGGWVKIHRKFIQKQFYSKDSEKVHLWIHLLLKSNHTGRNESLGGQPYFCKSGEFTTGRKQISIETGINESKVERILNFFEKKEQQIKQRKTNSNRLISIVNWEMYQISEQQDEQLSNNDRTTIEQQSNSNRTHYKNDNKEDDSTFISKEWPISKMPLPSDFNGLPEIKIGSIIQFFKYTKKVDLTSERVLGVWESFKIVALTGKKYYEDNEAVYSHFFNWVKDQKFEDGHKHNQSGTKLSKDEALRNF